MRISDWSSDVCSSDLADLDIREEFFHRSRTFTFQNGELVAARQKRGGELQSPLFAARCGGAQPSRQRGYVGSHKAIRIQEPGVVIAAGDIFDHSVAGPCLSTATPRIQLISQISVTQTPHPPNPISQP